MARNRSTNRAEASTSDGSEALPPSRTTSSGSVSLLSAATMTSGGVASFGTTGAATAKDRLRSGMGFTTTLTASSSASMASGTISAAAAAAAVTEEDHPDLADLEQQLTEQVDDEFFQDPRKFHTLHRVIDVLGMQMVDDLTGISKHQQHQDLSHVDRNPAYRALKEQQAVVEHAIEHLALIHCADLNGSVVQVGRVARQFHDAVTKVRSIRKQVKEIQETLGAGQVGPVLDNAAATNTSGTANATTGTNSNNNNNNNNKSAAVVMTAASAMSLRELWLKKLECEAVLSLLEKLDRIRGAPLEFDRLTAHHRIGAAVIGLAQALDTMFSTDVAQVQALHKIMEQLMIRKQKAEEIVWQILLDVLFLRTGNGMAWLLATGNKRKKLTSLSSSGMPGATTASTSSVAGGGAANNATNSAASIVSGSDNKTPPTNNNNSNNNNNNPQAAAAQQAAASNALLPMHHQNPLRNIAAAAAAAASSASLHNTQNPFLTPRMRFCLEHDLELSDLVMSNSIQIIVDDDDDAAAASNLYDYESDAESVAQPNDTNAKPSTTTASAGTAAMAKKHAFCINQQLLEAEFDLEADERRFLEEVALQRGGASTKSSSNMSMILSTSSNKKRNTSPTYQDPVLALRTLVECLTRLRRLDDIERILSDSLEKELKVLVQREQARTFLRLEKNNKQLLTTKGGRYTMLQSRAGSTTDLRDFRKHLNSLISAFGNVMIRFSHLAQILRHVIVSRHSTGLGCSTNTKTNALPLLFPVCIMHIDSRTGQSIGLFLAIVRPCIVDSIRQKLYGTRTQDILDGMSFGRCVQ